MQSDTFRCDTPESCERVEERILSLRPAPGRPELEKNATLTILGDMYSVQGGSEFLVKLEKHTVDSQELPVFSPFPSLGQLQTPIERAYKDSYDDHLFLLLRAFDFYFGQSSGQPSESFNSLAAIAAGSLTLSKSIGFCGACGLTDTDLRNACPACGSGVLVLSSYTIPQEVKEGLRYHVPSELYAATSLESAGYHLVQVKRAGNSYRTSLTFNAFGAKVDVDCVGIGHPPCILLLCVTTSKVDQTKAMTTKGTLDNLEKLMRERYTDFPPVHKVLVTTDVVDSNVDPIGIEKTGMTILDRSSILDLDKEMAKIPSRITTRV